MKAIIISLALCFLSISLQAQDNNHFQKGEVLISLRNPNFGLRDIANDQVDYLGTNLDLGYCIKDKIMIGLGGQSYYTWLSGSSNDIRSWGIQIFGRYYFAARGKKQQFNLYVEPRIEGIRVQTQSWPLAGNFINTRDDLIAGLGFFCAWRPINRFSLDLGIQPQTRLGRIMDPGQEDVIQLGLSLPLYGSLNLYL